MSSYVSKLKKGNKIGEGYFGEVFLGKDEVHGEVAIKIITKASCKDSAEWTERKADLLKEAQNLKKATHKNVVEVYHLVESDSDDAILYVMEYCSGGCLSKKFKNGPMKIDDVKDILTDVALGLSALHSRGMIHRDIKPSNILRDGKGVTKLGDFGLVTDELIFGYASDQGYLDHLAYETWHGHGTSVKTDIWALGLTIYRLLHGSVWYSEGPVQATL